jgi:hypothetical protein
MVPFYEEGEPKVIATPTPPSYQTPAPNTPQATPTRPDVTPVPGGDNGGDGDDGGGIGAVEIAGGAAAAAALVGLGGFLYARSKGTTKPQGGPDGSNSD